MSFLYPLFLAGLAVVGLPILLHLIRRHTRKRVAFSSLMFLRPEPPQFRHRNRVEQWPLLLLRCLIVCLLALIFARPFLARSSQIPASLPSRRIVLLVDTSASMQRENLWEKAMQEVRAVLENVTPRDHVCIMTFDKIPRTLMSFFSWNSLDPEQQKNVALNQLGAVSPTWQGTHLGQALVAAAEMLEDKDVNEHPQGRGIRYIVLISDMQQGSDIEALRAYEWPKNIRLEVVQVSATGTTNASLHLGVDRSYTNDTIVLRLQNSKDAVKDQFQLTQAQVNGPNMEVYVPAGHSTVVSLSAEEYGSADQFVLLGDDHGFDNTLYISPQHKAQINVLYLGRANPQDPQAMLYYIMRAFNSDVERNFHVTSLSGAEPLSESNIMAAHVIIVTDTMLEDNLAMLGMATQSGTTVLLPLISAKEGAAMLAGLLHTDPVHVHEAEVDGYAMLTRLDLDHPVLAPFADPRFSDFSHVHIWQYRQLDAMSGKNTEIPVWLDTGDPAMIIRRQGRGMVVVTAFGWHPGDSDLALSSKFVPLLYGILEYSGIVKSQPSRYFVGDGIPVPLSVADTDCHVRKPNGETISLEPGQSPFNQTDQPGLYTFVCGSEHRVISVNIPLRESHTTPMSIESLESLGVTLGTGQESHLHAQETSVRHAAPLVLEYEQKFWRGLLAGLLVVLLMEIWLGGRLIRVPSKTQGEGP